MTMVCTYPLSLAFFFSFAPARTVALGNQRWASPKVFLPPPFFPSSPFLLFEVVFRSSLAAGITLGVFLQLGLVPSRFNHSHLPINKRVHATFFCLYSHTIADLCPKRLLYLPPRKLADVCWSRNLVREEVCTTEETGSHRKHWSRQSSFPRFLRAKKSRDGKHVPNRAHKCLSSRYNSSSSKRTILQCNGRNSHS